MRDGCSLQRARHAPPLPFASFAYFMFIADDAFPILAVARYRFQSGRSRADLKESTVPRVASASHRKFLFYAWTGEPKLMHISAQRRHAVPHSFAILPWDALSQAFAQALHNSAHSLRISAAYCDSRITKFEHVWQISAQSFAICIVLESTPPLLSSATQHFWQSLQASMHSCTCFEIVWFVMFIPQAFSVRTERALSTFRRFSGK
jgi:hypothetical protein